jgi:hypothetical protein
MYSLHERIRHRVRRLTHVSVSQRSGASMEGRLIKGGSLDNAVV